MAASETSKTALSSNVLQMKFMKKTALKKEKEQSEVEKQHIIDDEHWVLDLPATQQKESRFITEASCERLENLVYGRMSFKGFNPEVEKLMISQNESITLAEAERKEKEIGVDAKEMAERYTSLIGTVSNKFKTKRERQQEEETTPVLKKKFRKPAED